MRDCLKSTFKSEYFVDDPYLAFQIHHITSLRGMIKWCTSPVVESNVSFACKWLLKLNPLGLDVVNLYMEAVTATVREYMLSQTDAVLAPV